MNCRSIYSAGLLIHKVVHFLGLFGFTDFVYPPLTKIKHEKSQFYAFSKIKTFKKFPL